MSYLATVFNGGQSISLPRNRQVARPNFLLSTTKLCHVDRKLSSIYYCPILNFFTLSSPYALALYVTGQEQPNLEGSWSTNEGLRSIHEGPRSIEEGPRSTNEGPGQPLRDQYLPMRDRSTNERPRSTNKRPGSSMRDRGLPNDGPGQPIRGRGRPWGTEVYPY